MKNLKQGLSYETPFGEQWANAILSVDKVEIDYLRKTARVEVHIYMDDNARTAEKSSFNQHFFIKKEDFENIDMGQPINSLKTQLEDWVLTLTEPDYSDPDNPTEVLIYPDFE
jgi:hypothetical protein